MQYMIEYTLFATLAFHHLSIGIILLIGVNLLNKVLVQNTEMKSWLLMSVFLVATVTPFTLINIDNLSANAAQADSIIDAQQLSHHIYEIVENAESRQASDVQSISASSERFWHIRPSLVFDFSFLFSIALSIWLVGSLWRVNTVFCMWVRTQKLTQSLGSKSTDYSDYLGLPVYISDKISSPMVLGYFSVKVLIPQNIISALNTPQIEAILQHEKAHIIRKDNVFALFQELIAIVFWWSPVMRRLNTLIHVQREMACDIRAANNCISRKQYAQSLLDCAKLMVHQHKSVLAMGLLSKKKVLKQRISLVLTQKSPRTVRTSLIILVCAFFSVFSIQAAQMLAPQISIKHTTDDALHYSLLSFDEGQVLINAVMQNDIDAIVALQAEGVDINTPAIGDGTALMIAIKNNNLIMADKLIALGANVNQSSRGDGNPLIVAAMRNNLAATQMLLAHGAEIDAVVQDDETALITASFYGHLNIVSFLLENGADINKAVTTGRQDGFDVRTALSRANNDEMRALLLENGAEITE